MTQMAIIGNSFVSFESTDYTFDLRYEYPRSLAKAAHKYKYTAQTSIFVINSILRYFELIGIPLLIVTLAVSFLPMFETTMVNGVFAQTIDTGGVSDDVVLNSEVNETAANGNNITSGPKFLFIQNAQSGSLSDVNATTSTLELNEVSDKTIMFSDRPDRIVAATNTTDFIGNWSSGPDSFSVVPPNAVLILDDEVQRHLAVIELFNPEYDPEANTLKFDITAVNATTTTTTTGPIGLPGEFGQSTMVIDSSFNAGIAKLIVDGSDMKGTGFEVATIHKPK